MAVGLVNTYSNIVFEASFVNTKAQVFPHFWEGEFYYGTASLADIAQLTQICCTVDKAHATIVLNLLRI